ncbi:MAG: FAD-binding oxidoreductase [Pseudomonadota bacterium]
MTTAPADLLDELAAIVGAEHIRRSNELAVVHPGVDERNLDAGVAVRPGSTEEVAAVLAACERAGVAIVTHGGRTGLAAGGVSTPGQIILTTERIQPIEVDPVERLAVVGAGVTLQALQEAAAAHGLSPGIDIAARGTATIGGMISTNAGGMEAFRYGMMRQRLLGLTAVTANGTVMRDDARVTKANEGYDLKQLFCGAEGTLGVVTEAVVRLVKVDPPSQTIMMGVETAEAALRVTRAFEDAGSLLLTEIMWRLYVDRVTQTLDLTDVISFADAPIYAIVEIAGEADAALETLAPFMEDGTVVNAIMAQNEREKASIWRIREDTQAVRKKPGEALWFDISVPLAGLDAYVDGLRARLTSIDPAYELSALGHLADGNLHMTVTGDGPLTDTDPIYLAVEEGLKASGGSISAEHGIGLAKLGSLSRNSSDGALALMRAVKAALDPKNILNPGKVVPG